MNLTVPNTKVLLDSPRFHEGEPALHEEDDDGHDEEEEVVDVVRLLGVVEPRGDLLHLLGAVDQAERSKKRYSY